MPCEINETHDPNLKSWVESANDPETDFPIQNLPFGRFDLGDGSPAFIGVPIGDMVVHLGALQRGGFLSGISLIEDTSGNFDLAAMPGFMAQPRAVQAGLRARLVQLLDARTAASSDLHKRREGILLKRAEVRPTTPVFVQNYSDFYASIHHATNVGSMFRPDNALLPNYKHIPIGYHGRASSIVVSGTEIRRPRGQMAPPDNDPSAGPSFGPCRMLDYELEVGALIGRGNELGEPISIHDADRHIFGLCLVNDWSARDIQKWEYQPLGPFLAKNFATTISPYIITMEALAPFHAPAFKRPPTDPKPLPYLSCERDQASGAFNITLEVHLASKQMRERGMSPVRLSTGNFREMYWTFAQMVAHHTSNGCNLQPGDLLASGTVSGPTRESRGCMLELTWDGDPWADPPRIVPGSQRTPIRLPTGEQRRFLEDGDEVIMKGYCERAGFRRIGFGECRGIITPAKER